MTKFTAQLARTYAPAPLGIEAQAVTIECDISNGLPGIIIVGLADKAVDESKDRIRSALKNSGLSLPPKRITINLAPAHLRKDGSTYDIALAIAILIATGQLDQDRIGRSLFLGELALDGTIRAVTTTIAAAELANVDGFERIYTSIETAPLIASATNAKVFGIHTLEELYWHLVGITPLSPIHATPLTTYQAPPEVDLADVIGHEPVKRAIEISAAGGHNLLMVGPPGTGKTMLAKAMLGLLPALSLSEALDIIKVANAAGQSVNPASLSRPFRSPHHTASSIALIGGGSKPRPGEISLSHHGILFLDEMPEFPRHVLEVLRQPLEDGKITISRASGSITFPANFTLIGTQNPCPCGYYGDPARQCTCPPTAISRYQNKISGPLLDRIDLFCQVRRLPAGSLMDHPRHTKTSADYRESVQAARNVQTKRQYVNAPTNSGMTSTEVQFHCKLDNETAIVAESAVKQLGISSRGYMRTLKVARTIADLGNSAQIKLEHFTEALQYRNRD